MNFGLDFELCIAKIWPWLLLADIINNVEKELNRFKFLYLFC